MSTLSTNTIIPVTGTTVTLGESGDTISLASGASATGFGKVLQVVSSTKTDTFTTSTQSFVDTGLAVSITPASGTKVLVLVNFTVGRTASDYAFSRIVRDSTAICIGDAASNRARVTWNNNQSDWTHTTFEMGMNYLDTHGANGSTAVTYKVQFNSIDGGTMKMNATNSDSDLATSGSRSASSITVMEIGA